MKYFYAYLYSQKAATATEYALIAAGVSVALVASIFIFGDELEALYTETLPNALTP
ncbi:MAG: Flp family type IVb pilin [Pseudomonadota bacterium]